MTRPDPEAWEARKAVATVADICQADIDRINAALPATGRHGEIITALAQGVLDLLYLARNTDMKARQDRAEYEAKYGKIGEGSG